MLVRSWNLYHGNTVPRARRAYLDDMVRLASADDPDILCLQEVPVWALRRFTIGDRAASPTLGPFPIPASVGRALTASHYGLLRSLFAGQGNAMQLGPRLRLVAHAAETLNSGAFRSAQSAELGLDLVMRLAWAKERRVVQFARVVHDDGRRFLVANTHCTSSRDSRIPGVELRRVLELVVEHAEPGEVVVVAGDLNVRGDDDELSGLVDEYGFSSPGPGIDHVLVRGAQVGELRVWDASRRMREGVLLSDHAPVDLEIE